MNEYERGSGGMILTGETEIRGINNVFQCHLAPRHTLRGMIWEFFCFLGLKFGQTSERQTRACYTPHHSTAPVQVQELIRILQKSTTATTSSLSYFTDSLSSSGLVTLMHASTEVLKGRLLALPVHAL